MPRILGVIVLSVLALGQTAPIRIPPEVAAKHFIKTAQPQYPSAAEMARIQGSVILEIAIDESGAVSVRRLISGHPMLAPAAIQAVNQWRYEPPLADGKPTTAVTDVLVSFGDAAYYPAQGRAMLAFQNDFWTAEESAETFLTKGDYLHAEDHMNKMNALVSADKQGGRHLEERWQWMTLMGRLRMSQRKHEEAEQYFKDALALRENNGEDKNAPEIALSLAYLGALFAEEKRFDLAYENASRALDIYQKNFKKAGKNTAVHQAYGRAIANESRMLLKVAAERNDATEAGKQCHTLMDFQSFLNATDRDSIVPACQAATAKPTSKP